MSELFYPRPERSLKHHTFATRVRSLLKSGGDRWDAFALKFAGSTPFHTETGEIVSVISTNFRSGTVKIKGPNGISVVKTSKIAPLDQIV